MSFHTVHIPRLTSGVVHLPGEAGYDEQRRAINPAVDSRPLMVIEAGDTEDVRAAVLAAGECGVPLAIQATGHGTHAPADGGILLKTSRLDSVIVDPVRRTALVGPGARWGKVLDAARPFGLAPLAGSSRDVGVTGFTLGGGLGWLSRRYGFAADSVLRAELVTADGRTLTASRDENPELFWALRGGGGNFGVVTALEFRLYPVREVQAGIIELPAGSAAEAMETYRALTERAPDELSTALMLSPTSVAVKVMYAGTAEEARKAVPYEGLRTMAFADASMGGTPARHFDLFESLTTPVAEAALAASGEATVEIRHWGGAMGTTAGTGPVGHRNAHFSVIVNEALPWLPGTLSPHAIGGSFVNFLADTTRTRTAYTAADYAGLADVKRAYDPDATFGLGHTIR